MKPQAQMKTKPTQGWRKYFNKDLIPIFLNIALAAASVLLIGPWIDYVLELETSSMIFNFAAAVTAGAAVFIAKTHYNKGTWNIIKKTLMVTSASALTIYFSFLSAGTADALWYPFTGVFIVLVTFYMISLSTETLGLIGISAAGMLLGIGLVGLYTYSDITGDTLLLLTKASMLLILFLGGVLAKIRMYLHGIRGTNNDGGFGRVGDDADDYGDEGDGDGDTGDE